MAHPRRTLIDMIASGALVVALTASAAQAGAAHPVAGMVGLGFDQVREALGEPDVAQVNGAGALWTYRLDACALMLAFRDGASGFRVSEVMSGPRRRGDKATSPAQCLQSGEAAHRAASHAKSVSDPAPQAVPGPR